MFICILFASLGKTVDANWGCDNVGPSQTPPVPFLYRCVEIPPGTGFTTLRGCLRGVDDLSSPDVNKAGGNNCVDDPRWVMRNFAALNFWSVGKVMSLGLPLATAIGALICGVFMLYGALQYIQSNGEEKKLTDATHTMTYAAIGLVIIIVAYMLVRTLLIVTKTNTFGF